MLAYAYKALKEGDYRRLGEEEFDNIHNLLAAILSTGINQQLKQGLYHRYLPLQEDLPTLRGKLNLSGTILNQMQGRRLLNCEYDQFSKDNLYNQILKTACFVLLQQELEAKCQSELRRIMQFFGGIRITDPACINWSTLNFHRNNQNYQTLLAISRLVLADLLPATAGAEHKMKSFLDPQQQASLFEKFVLEYYRYHYPDLKPAPCRIAWNAKGEAAYLPSMITDITLKHKDKTLIIDTKFYESGSMASHFGRKILHSAHLYQIFAYVKNYDRENTGNVAGLLLYAKTDEAVTPDFAYQISGSNIAAAALNLNQPFAAIAAELDQIAENFTSH